LKLKCDLFSQTYSAYLQTAIVCLMMLLPWQPRRWHSTYIKLFKRNQFAVKCRWILRKKSCITGLFWWSYANLF